MRYTLVVSPAARRDLKAIHGGPRRHIAAAIDGLADEPRPRGCTKLAGEDSLYRIRIADYRVLYQIEDRRLLVLIVRVGHRRDVYGKDR